MCTAETGRKQALNRVTKQFLASVSKEIFGLGIDENNLTRFIDYHHGVGCGFEQVTEWLEDY